MSLSQQQQIFIQNVALLILKANSLGVNLTGGELFRTEDQQSLYFYGYTLMVKDYRLLLVKEKKKTKTMNSNHLRRLAIDFNFFIKGELLYDHPLITELGKYWESLHYANRAGMFFESFKDAPHFEMNI